MARSAVFVACLALAALLGVQASWREHQSTPQQQDTLYTLRFGEPKPDALTSSFLVNATNAAYVDPGPGKNIKLAINRAVLAPCAARTMHLHRNVDEAYLVLEGPVGFAMSAPNGSIIHEPALHQHGVFIVPANWVHTFYNPSCSKSVSVLAFQNTDNAARDSSDISPGALNMPAGPFLAYADPRNVESMKLAAESKFAFDPQCLARCRNINTKQARPTNTM